MELKKNALVFVSFILISERSFAGYQSFWGNVRGGGVGGYPSNWIGYAVASIFMLSAVTTIVIWKSYLSEWILKKSVKTDLIWDIKKLKSHTRESIRRLNDALENKDLSPITDLLTLELFDELNLIVSELIKKGEKNILRCNNIKVLEIIGCEDYKDNSFDKYEAYIQGYMLNYTILESTGEIIKNKESRTWDFSHIYQFIRVENSWKLEKINNSANILDVIKTKNLIEK